MHDNEKPSPGSSGDLVADIEKFQRHYGFDKVKVTYTFLRNQLDFLMEEILEAEDALINKDADALYDSVIDLIVVAVGTAEFMAKGKTREGWCRVMNKNFQKKVGFNEKRPNSQGIDLIKPDGWVPPTHKDLVEKLQDLLNSATDHEIEAIKKFSEVEERESVKVLLEAAELMRKKSQTYANPNSSVKAADYYPDGSKDFIYMIDVSKRLRQTSIIEALEKDPDSEIFFESLEDTLIDRINYLALWVEFLRGKTPGQAPNRDIFNREVEDEPS